MTKHLLRFAVIILVMVTVFSSCKKKHDLHDYPNNIRLRNFTKITTFTGNPVLLYETYAFGYDGFNRVIKITHTKNDGSSNLVSDLTYRNDSVYDVTTLVNTTTLWEIDTFIADKKGLITITYEPGNVTTYDYSGILLTRKKMSAGDEKTYTSYNSNLLKGTSNAGTANDVSYTYYTDKFNRIGDYLQINGFQKYGFNFYQNDNLVWKILTSSTTIDLQYEIDADNKITKTTATTMTPAGGVLKTEVYDLQYETYK